MKIKANPFLMLASDYHEFDAYQQFLERLFPNTKVTFEEVSREDVEEELNNDSITVRSPEGYNGYVAWFTLQSESDIEEEIQVAPLTTEEVKESCEWVIADLKRKANARGLKDLDLSNLYLDDAADYENIIQLLDSGNVVNAVKKYAYLDTAARDYIWNSPIVRNNEEGFNAFLEAEEF